MKVSFISSSDVPVRSERCHDGHSQIPHAHDDDMMRTDDTIQREAVEK